MDVPRQESNGSGERLSFVVIMGVHTGTQAGRLVEGKKEYKYVQHQFFTVYDIST